MFVLGRVMMQSFVMVAEVLSDRRNRDVKAFCDHIADIFTKPLRIDRFIELKCKLGLCSIKDL